MIRSISTLIAVCACWGANALTLNLQVQNETCTYANGSVYAAVSGGVPPYTYLWGGGETTESISGLSVGTYTVTVTDFEGTQVSDQATVITEDYGSFTSGLTHSYCPGQNYHEFFFPPQPPGVPADVTPWTASQGVIGEVPPPAAPNNYYLDLGPISPGAGFNVTYWDVNGCTGQLSGTAGAPITSWPSFAVVDIQGSCANVPTGQVTFSSSPVTSSDTYYVLKAEGSGEYDFQPNFQVVGPDVFAFGFLAPGNYWLLHRLGMTFSHVQGGGCKSDSVLVTIPNYGPTCGTISGSTYMDYNSDCIDAEADASNVVVEIQPGPIYTTSGGSYSVVVPNGSYTMTTSAPAIGQSCPASATVNGNNVVANIGHQPTIPLDVSIGLASGPARPGFELQYAMNVENLSSSASGAMSITFTFDPAVTLIEATPTPTSVVGSTLTWNQSSLDIFQERDYHIRLQVPPDVGLIGTELLASTSVTTANSDGDLGNNSASAAITVTGSYDPNDKTAYTSTRWSQELYYINQDSWIDYVIRFQNTGTDTAFNIVVTDTLPATLDPATISLVSASHMHTWMVQGQGTLKFIFPNILLPDSNANEAASHGLVSFRIRPRQPVLPGTVIANTANIFFDYNDPVITEPSVLTAEFSTGQAEGPGEVWKQGQLHLLPNPASDLVRLSDDKLAAATRTWAIQCSDGRIVRSSGSVFPAHGADISDLAVGNYLLQLISNDRSVVIHFAKTH